MNGKTIEVCQVCEQPKDLRYGACFDCADTVLIEPSGVCRDERTGKVWMVRADWEDREKSAVYVVKEQT